MSNVMAVILPWALILVQLLVATMCGGMIGYQRELLERPAGFRTHMLVCVGSAVYMLVSVAVAGGQYDPGRIAAQVASGIGFLGAGTIIKQGSVVRGLTTAASLWATAGIGLAVGFGGTALVIALLSTLIVLIALTTMRGLEHRTDKNFSAAFYLTVTRPRERLEWLRQSARAHGVKIVSLSFREEAADEGVISVEGVSDDDEGLETLITVLAKTEGVSAVRWERR